jgi:DNA-binding MarR family transcriptional regulator
MFYWSPVSETWRPECAEDELLVALFALKRALQSKSVGTDPGVYHVLHQLAVSGPMRSGTLAERLGLDASTVSRHVRALVDDGLVDATRDPDDRRATVLAITAPGQERMATRLKAHRARLEAATSTFTPQERAELIRLLTMLAAALGDQEELR